MSAGSNWTGLHLLVNPGSKRCISMVGRNNVILALID